MDDQELEALRAKANAGMTWLTPDDVLKLIKEVYDRGLKISELETDLQYANTEIKQLQK